MSQNGKAYGTGLPSGPNNSRPFTTLGTATTSDHTSNGTTLPSTFGGQRGVLGSNNTIWSSGSFTKSFPSRDVTSNNSRPHDSRQSSVNEEITEGKKGSGALVDSSVGDDWSYKTLGGAKRSLPSGRSVSQTQYSGPSTYQPRSTSNAGLQTSFANTPQNSKPFAPRRPPTINVNGTSSAETKSGLTSSYPFGFTPQASEQPPNVYTKFDRPTEPNFRRQPDSAKDGFWSDHSPTDERKSSITPLSSRTGSTPASRDGSMPFSRFGEQKPSFGNIDWPRTSQRPTQTNSRAPSISSPTNGAYNTAINSDVNPDQLAWHLHQLKISNGINSRPATSHKNSLGSGVAFGQLSPMTTAAPFSRSTAAGSGVVDDARDFDQTDNNYYVMDSYLLPEHAGGNWDYPLNGFSSRDLEAPTHNQPGARLPYANGGIPVHLVDASNLRSNIGWPNIPDAGAMSTRRLPGLQEQNPYVDLRIPPQMLAPQLRSPYHALYNPYAVQQALHFNGAPGYAPLLPMNVSLAETNVDPRDLTTHSGESMQSSLMYEFKSNPKGRRYELKDIYDHIAEFSGDQHGSRFIQTKLETANSDEKERVFQEIEPNALQLMTDVFGNYVIQKFFEHGDQLHKRILANKMKGEVLNLSLQMYGCRVVQKALDHVLVDQQRELVSELEGQILKCVKDQNGNHVIQKAIERCPPATIGFIIRSFEGDVQHLSIHPYGCRVIQRCLERCEPAAKSMIMKELMCCMETLISDQYGNYVVQHVVEHNEGPGVKLVLDMVARSLEAYSKHKFASNVVEKCLEMADDHWRRLVVYTLANARPQRREGEGAFVSMIKDSYGNYVIQKLLDTLNPEDYSAFVEMLQPALAQAKRTGCGKQVLSIDKKMHKSINFRGAPANGGTYNDHMYRLSIPASFSTSAATTPPPLTNDQPSLQSSNLSSIDGDAVEGAAFCSRKASQHFHNDMFR